MSDENRSALLYATKGNIEAMLFLETITDVLHFFDDVADCDNPLSHSNVEKACFDALVTLPRNRFYQQNFVDLNALVANAIISWRTANEIEWNRKEQTEHMLRVAFIIRSDYAALVNMVALLVGGYEHAFDVSKRVREVWHNEQFSGYMSALDNQFLNVKE